MEDTSKGVGRMRMRLPEEFRRRMERLLGEESAAFYAALDGPAHRGLRVNTLKCTIEAFRKRFPLPLTPVPFSPSRVSSPRGLEGGRRSLASCGRLLYAGTVRHGAGRYPGS